MVFFELPDRLWAVADYKINDLKSYTEFGRLRNQIIHFAVNNQDSFSDLTLKFAFEIIEPAVSHFWGESLLKYVQDETNYIEERLNELGIKYLSDK